jgi:hypothetical protein
MHEKDGKILSILLKVIALAILTIVAYWGAVKLILAFGYSQFPMIFLISIIVFDVLYLSTVKFWPLKNIHIKIIVALLLFACSAALVTVFIVLYELRNFRW